MKNTAYPLSFCKRFRCLLLLCAPLLLGCSKDDSPRREETTYVFERIRYDVDRADGDGTTEKSREVSRSEAENPGAVPVDFTVVYDPFGGENEYATFSCDVLLPGMLKTEWTPIRIPESVSPSGEILFRSGKETFRPDTTFSYPCAPGVQITGTGTTRLQPGCRLVSTTSIRYHETVVSYTATFTHKESGEIAEITGKCTTNRMIGSVTDTVISMIE